MILETVKERITQLRKEIKEHDERYDNNMPIISDSAYDLLYAELVELEERHPEFFDPNSPTQKISLKPVAGLEKVKHNTPLLSLEKTTTFEGIDKFMQRLNGTSALVQEKLDGLTILLHYENGVLFDAVTRGSGGVEGERVLHTVRTISNLPKQIPYKGTLKLRSEVIVPYEEFERVNVDGKYSNPRNLASGTVRQLDPSVAASRGLKAIVFDIIEGPSRLMDNMQMLEVEKLGFEIVTTYHCSTVEDIIAIIDEYNNGKRSNLPYMIDGLVLKANTISLRETLGVASKYPKWAIAYKFKSLDEVTKLNNVTWQVGKSGQLTPVAELTPVEIDSVTVSRATLHNFSNIETKDIRIGDTVVVERANDVIPQVVKPLSELRTGAESIIELPQKCPSCGAPTILDGANLFCNGSSCLPQLEGKIKHFVSRDALNIDGLGDKTVELFIEKGFITSVADLYELDKYRNEICQLEGFGDKKFAKFMEGLETSKNRELHQFIYGLSIQLIGQRASKDLAKHFKSMDNILEAAMRPEYFREEILSIPQFGPIMANSLVTFFSDEQNIILVKKLQGYGLNSVCNEENTSSTQNNLVNGKTFVITGEVYQFPNRKVLQAELEKLGAKVVGSVSSKTDYLINNDINSSSSKNTKAKSLGVPILSEDEVLKLMNSTETTTQYSSNSNLDIEENLDIQETLVSTKKEDETPLATVEQEITLDELLNTSRVEKSSKNVENTILADGQVSLF